jgi:hypothetical protein
MENLPLNDEQIDLITATRNEPEIGNLFENTILWDDNWKKKTFYKIADKISIESASSELRDKGIKQVSLFEEKNISEMTFNEPTLVIFPITEELELSTISYKGLDRRKTGYCRYTKNVPSRHNKEYFSTLFCSYFVKKNLILLKINPFYNMDIWVEVISDLQSFNIRKYDQENARELMMKELIEKGINKLMNENESNLMSAEVSKINLQLKYKDTLKRLQEYQYIKEGFVEMKKSKLQSVYNDINETSKYPHIKEIKITEEGIEIYTDFISIEFKKKIYQIGELKFIVNSDEYLCINMSRATGYPHPHAQQSGHMCFGDLNLYAQEVKDKMKFKDIIKLLIAWSFAYAPTNRPYTQIEDFKEDIRFVVPATISEEQ